jgi:hypothetical protein
MFILHSIQDCAVVDRMLRVHRERTNCDRRREGNKDIVRAGTLIEAAKAVRASLRLTTLQVQ